MRVDNVHLGASKIRPRLRQNLRIHELDRSRDSALLPMLSAVV